MKSKAEAIIWDLDNTLVDVTGILKYAREDHPEFVGEVNYDRYHTESLKCPPHSNVLESYKSRLAEGFIPLIVTARQGKYYPTTAEWLSEYSIYPVEIHFRENGDIRPDAEVKAEILADLRKRYTIVEAWDDNPHVIEYWKSQGIPVVEVPSWPEWAK